MNQFRLCITTYRAEWLIELVYLSNCIILTWNNNNRSWFLAYIYNFRIFIPMVHQIDVFILNFLSFLLILKYLALKLRVQAHNRYGKTIVFL